MLFKSLTNIAYFTQIIDYFSIICAIYDIINLKQHYQFVEFGLSGIIMLSNIDISIPLLNPHPGGRMGRYF